MKGGRTLRLTYQQVLIVSWLLVGGLPQRHPNEAELRIERQRWLAIDPNVVVALRPWQYYIGFVAVAVPDTY